VCRTPTINHAAAVFIENKRYREEQALHADVVNRKRGFVYQTDALLTLNVRVHGALSARQRRNSAEYVDDQKHVFRAAGRRGVFQCQFNSGCCI
jgi:hypothetical protein